MERLDCSRIKDFRQFKRDIRGSKEYLIVGIDIAKENHNAFMGSATGKTLLKRLVFENSAAGFEKLKVQAESIRVQNGLSKVVFGLEPTACYHKPLAEYLINDQQRLVYVSGEVTKKNRTSLDGRWDKHDAKDSANVADLISQGKCLFYDHPPLPLRELRNLLSLKIRLKKQEHGLRVRIRNHLLAQFFPELDPFFANGGPYLLSIVKWCLAPRDIAIMDFKEFLKIVAPGLMRGNTLERLKKIWEIAPRSIGCEAGSSLPFEGKMMVELLIEIRKRIKALDEKIEEICLLFPAYPLLLSIPGFGPDVSAKVLAAIGDPFRFDNRSQVIRIAGYDLSAERSGNTSDRAVPVISKKGKASLRYALYQAAIVASTRNKEFIQYFTEKLKGREKERGIKTKMRVKLAAKMLVIAWTLMKKKESFDPKYLNHE
jgi:transposase